MSISLIDLKKKLNFENHNLDAAMSAWMCLHLPSQTAEHNDFNPDMSDDYHDWLLLESDIEFHIQPSNWIFTHWTLFSLWWKNKNGWVQV